MSLSAALDTTPEGPSLVAQIATHVFSRIECPAGYEEQSLLLESGETVCYLDEQVAVAEPRAAGRRLVRASRVEL